MGSSPLNCPHKTNVHTPQETKFSQRTGDLLLAHSKQTDCVFKQVKKIASALVKLSPQENSPDD